MSEMPKLQYMCEVCGNEIADDQGGIAVSYKEIHEYEEAHRKFDDEHDDGHGVSFNMREYSDANLPDWAHWWTVHWTCSTVVNPYEVPVEDVRTHAGVVHWVSHLLEKSWLQSTDLHKWLNALPSEDSLSAMAAVQADNAWRDRRRGE